MNRRDFLKLAAAAPIAGAGIVAQPSEAKAVQWKLTPMQEARQRIITMLTDSGCEMPGPLRDTDPPEVRPYYAKLKRCIDRLARVLADDIREDRLH